MTDAWSVSLRAINGAEVVSSVPVKDWSFRRVLNGPGSFDAKLNMADTGVTRANYTDAGREIVVYRNGKREWGGYLVHVEVNTPTPGSELVIRGEGYYGRLRQRIVMSDLVYQNTNQQTIAWNLVAHTQAQGSGDLGFTQGAHTGSLVQRDRDYCAMDRPGVASGIEDLAQQIDGFDFEVSPDKKFNTYNPRKQEDVALSLPTFDQTNTTRLDYEIDLSAMASMVVFQGEDDCNPPFGNVSDAASLTAYGLLQESLDTGSTSWDESRKFAQQELVVSRVPRWQASAEWFPTVTGAVPWGAIDTGSIVTVSSANGFSTFTRPMRITEIGADFNPGFQPRYTATFDDAVDDL